MGAHNTLQDQAPPRVLPEVYTFEDGRNALYVYGSNIVTEDLGDGLTGVFQVSDELIEDVRKIERGEYDYAPMSSEEFDEWLDKVGTDE